MATKTYLAIDLGASSGRVLAGRFDGSRLELEEVHRFENGGVPVGDHLHWDLLGLWSHIRDGLRAAGSRYSDVTSVGVDTWGVDFALLGRGDILLGNPSHYRDSHLDGMLEWAWSRVSREEIFAETGLQFLQINTLYQLLALQQQQSPLLDVAETFLMMPDVFHWLLTGEKANEITDASTTQFLNPRTGDWARSLLEKFDLPTHILQTLAAPGTQLGPLRAAVAAETGLRDARVVLPGSHDTASAVLAVPAAAPAADPSWCYISSGTWSLMGVEILQPLVNATCQRFNFTNEVGIAGTIRLLKNIGGLWLVQECRRIWQLAGREYAWNELVEAARACEPLESLVNPDHADFLAPTDMPQAIRAYCRRTSQAVPASDGEVIRCALESLAMRYRTVLQWIHELTGRRPETVHIVGGGTQNDLLCQMTADACNCRVLAGPVEATALGNILMQAVSAGDVAGIAEAREVIRASFDVKQYTPQDAARWDAAAERVTLD